MHEHIGTMNMIRVKQVFTQHITVPLTIHVLVLWQEVKPTTPTPPSSKGSVLHFILASSVSKEQSRNITTSPFAEVSACVFSSCHNNVVGADGNSNITQNHKLLFKMAGNQEGIVKALIFLKIDKG